jgi:formate dehydrogenase
MSEQVSFCRICEPLCGTVVTVQDGRATRIRPDTHHPVSKGFTCPKGIEFVHVQNDPDRLLHPMRRTSTGGFEQITWEMAIREIGARLRSIRARHGGSAIGWYAGNPSAFSHSHAIWSAGFVRGIGSPHYYTPNTQDTASRFAASALLYGNPAVVPIPDLDRTGFALLVGANPLVSRGSLVTAGNLRERLTGVVARGGRVVVVDPRRTETAKAFEHVAVRPDADSWLLLGLLHVMFAEGLVDRAAIAAQTRGIEVVEDAARRCTPEFAAEMSAVPSERIRELARAFAGAPAAVAYGRTGACLGRYATLVNVLIDTLNIVTGNLDRAGGAVFGRPPIDFPGLAARLGLATYDTYRSRVGGFPEVLAQLPAPLMAEEIETPGPGQLRALIVSAGNPVLSVPGSARLEAALDKLELQVGIDLYVNETHRHADYLLPATSFYERDDIVLPLLDFHLTPFVQWTDAVVPARGEARDDWQIIDDLAAELGFAPVAGIAAKWIGTGPLARRAARVLAPLARRATPQALVDVLLRTGRDGDWFGLRRQGLTLARLREHPHGIVLAPHVETGVLRRRVRHDDHRVHLDSKQVTAEFDRLLTARDVGGEFPLLLIGRREIRSHNSWMHNNPRFRDGERHQHALVNEADALAAGVSGPGAARIVSASGEIVIDVEISGDVPPGTVAVPHGWGHREAGWTVANAAAGANVNELTSSRTEDLERVSGMAHLTGVPVRLEAVRAPSGAAAVAADEPLAEPADERAAEPVAEPA